MPEPRWTVSILTIPGREPWLERLVCSLMDARINKSARICVVFNRDCAEDPAVIERRLRRLCGRSPIDVAFNMTEPTIVAGRQAQLNTCRTPRICFLDDDITVHGDVIGALDDALDEEPVGIVGLPSFVDDTPERFKPRDTTPSVSRGRLRYMPVQGMLVGGHRRLFLDVGGFNPRRRFWGEWTELNLRMWRHGFPGAYVMDGPFLRHWHAAPDSPTRNREGREHDILWGLMCTALEYDAVDITTDTASFWRLVEERYLAYAFGEALSPRRLLSSVLQLGPALTSEWGRIVEFRELTRQHPFKCSPFADLTPSVVDQITEHAATRLPAYRDSAIPLSTRRWRTRVAQQLGITRTA